MEWLELATALLNLTSAWLNWFAAKRSNGLRRRR